MVVWKLLEGIFFEVAGGVVWEIFQPYYKQHFHKSWNELYLDSFEMAFNSENVTLSMHIVKLGSRYFLNMSPQIPLLNCLHVSLSLSSL